MSLCSLLHKWFCRNLGCFDHLHESKNFCWILEVKKLQKNFELQGCMNYPYMSSLVNFAFRLQDWDRNRTLAISKFQGLIYFSSFAFLYQLFLIRNLVWHSLNYFSSSVLWYFFFFLEFDGWKKFYVSVFTCT